jgi:hypothetical protein
MRGDRDAANAESGMPAVTNPQDNRKDDQHRRNAS